MGWARLDDGWHDNRKIVAVGCEAAGLWVMCLTWAHKERATKPDTAGVVPDSVIARFAGTPTKAKRITAVLLEHGLFDEHTPRGWPIHDFADYLPPKRDPERLAEIGRKGGQATQERRRAAKQDSSDVLDGNEATVKQPRKPRAKPNQASRASTPAFPYPYPYPVVPTTETTSPSSALVLADGDGDEANAGKLIAEWLRARGTDNRPPSRVIGHVSRELKQMLAEGIPYETARNGFAEWAARNLHPSTLPSVVDEVRNGGRKNAPKPSTTDERVGAALDLARRFAGDDEPNDQLALGGHQ